MTMVPVSFTHVLVVTSQGCWPEHYSLVGDYHAEVKHSKTPFLPRNKARRLYNTMAMCLAVNRRRVREKDIPF